MQSRDHKWPKTQGERLSRRAHPLFCGLYCGLFAFTQPIAGASAQEPAETVVLEAQTESPVEVARAHFRKGVSLYRSGANDAALAEFSRAYEVAPNFRLLYNLAQIQAQRKRYVEATELFRRYLSEATEPLSAWRIRSVEAALEELRGLIGQLFLVVETSNSARPSFKDATLYVDGANYGQVSTQTSLALNAGVHRLRLESPGFFPASKTVTLLGGKEALSLMSLKPIPTAKPKATPPPIAPVTIQEIHILPAEPTDATLPWLSLGVTGALIGATTVLGMTAHSSKKKLDRQLLEVPLDPLATESSRTRLRNLAVATDVAGLFALAGLGLTTYLFASDTEVEKQERSLDWHALPSANGLSLLCSGRF